MRVYNLITFIIAGPTLPVEPIKVNFPVKDACAMLLSFYSNNIGYPDILSHYHADLYNNFRGLFSPQEKAGKVIFREKPSKWYGIHYIYSTYLLFLSYESFFHPKKNIKYCRM